jgi:predicted acyl esterase
MLQWLTYVHGRASNSGLFNSDTLWPNASWELLRSGKSFQELEKLVGIEGTVFKTWLAHPTEDAFWQAMTPRKEDFARLTLPILTIAGHFDADQRGALTYYDRHMANGQPEVTQKHLLVLGPWDHGGTRRTRRSISRSCTRPGTTTCSRAAPSQTSSRTASPASSWAATPGSTPPTSPASRGSP